MDILERELAVRGYEVDARAQVAPATLLRYFEHLRWEAIHALPEVALLFSEGRIAVVRAQRLELQREVGVGERLLGGVWLGKLGRTSVELRHELRLAASGEPVARLAMTGVVLDGSGRPSPLPEALRGFPVDDREWLSIAPLAPDQQPAAPVHLERLRVRPSHLDFLRHVNHAVYADWLDDTRQLAAASKGYGEASALAAGRLQRLSIDYRREAVLGDELELMSWLVPGGGIGCEVRRAAEPEPLCRARLEIEAA